MTAINTPASTDNRLRVAVLVSGRGSNLRALLAATDNSDYPAEIVYVAANRDAPALEYARLRDIPSGVFPRDGYSSRAERDGAIADSLHLHGAELVICAGYDSILSPAFIERFEGRIVNLHPSLLPAFAGSMDAIRLALEAGVEETGCTVHLVTNEVDAGPILAQSRVGVLPGDTLELLAARIHAAEHRLLPEIVRRLALQRVAAPAIP